MLLAFTLTMPQRGSWDGRWNGEDKRYVKVVDLGRTEKAKKNARKILRRGTFWYSWADGWGARIEVKHVNGDEARQLRKVSDGFSNYEWMVTSIINTGEINFREGKV